MLYANSSLKTTPKSLRLRDKEFWKKYIYKIQDHILKKIFLDKIFFENIILSAKCPSKNIFFLKMSSKCP